MSAAKIKVVLDKRFPQQVRDIVEGKVFAARISEQNKTDIEALFGSGEFDIMPEDLMDASKVATIETILQNLQAFMSLKFTSLQRTISIIQQKFANDEIERVGNGEISLRTSFFCLKRKDFHKSIAKVLANLEMASEVYEFFELVVHSEVVSLHQDFPHVYVHKNTLQMFTDEFVRSDQQLNTYDDYWGAVFEWARRENDGEGDFKGLQQIRDQHEEFVAMGVQGLKIWDKRHRKLRGDFSEKIAEHRANIQSLEQQKGVHEATIENLREKSKEKERN